jgi:hypothetical protein
VFSISVALEFFFLGWLGWPGLYTRSTTVSDSKTMVYIGSFTLTFRYTNPFFHLCEGTLLIWFHMVSWLGACLTLW